VIFGEICGGMKRKREIEGKKDRKIVRRRRGEEGQ